MKKLIAALLSIALGSYAIAQTTKTQLTTDINTNLADNTSGGITPAILRSVLQEMVNSYFDSVSTGQLAQNSTWLGNASGVPTATATACSPSAPGWVPATGGGTANFLRADCTFASPAAVTNITNAQLANMAAASLKANPSAAIAAPTDMTLQGLAAIGSVDANLDFMLVWNHTTGSLQRVTPGQVASSATSGVSSLGALTGAVLLGQGLGTTGGNTVQVPNNGIALGLLAQRTANSLLGNPTGGTANVAEVTIGSGLIFSAGTLNANAATVAFVGASNTFTANNAHSGAETFNGAVGFNSIAGFNAAATFNSAVNINSLAAINSTFSNTATFNSTTTFAAQVNALVNRRVAKSANYTVTASECGSTIALGGATSFTLTLPAPGGLPADCIFGVVNEDATRGKVLSVSGISSVQRILWPRQTKIFMNLNNVWTANTSQERWRWDTSYIFHVATTGTDTNDCLTLGSACATVQKAIDLVCRETDANGNTPLIQVHDGTYTSGFQLVEDCVGFNQVQVFGNIVTAANVVFTTSSAGNTIYAKDKGILTIRGFEIRPAVSGVSGVVCDEMSTIDVLTIRVTHSPAGFPFRAINHCVLNFNDSNSALIDTAAPSSATAGLEAEFGGIVNLNGFLLTVNGNWILFYTCYANGGILNLSGTIAAGGITTPGGGSRYFAQWNGIIPNGLANCTGTGAGTVALGGQVN